MKVQDGIHKDIHAAEGVGIEAVGRCVPGVAGAGILCERGAEPEAEDVIYVVSSNQTGLVSDKAQGPSVFLVGEMVLIDVEHRSCLQPHIKAAFVAELHRLRVSKDTGKQDGNCYAE